MSLHEFTAQGGMKEENKPGGCHTEVDRTWKADCFGWSALNVNMQICSVLKRQSKPKLYEKPRLYGLNPVGLLFRVRIKGWFFSCIMFQYHTLLKQHKSFH